MQTYEQIFRNDATALLAKLRVWAADNGVTLSVLEEGWPNGESIQLRKDSVSVEVTVKRPEELDTEAKLDRVWGLSICESVCGTRHLLARWPTGWRSYNRIVNDWNKNSVDLDTYLEALLPQFFGLSPESN